MGDPLSILSDAINEALRHARISKRRIDEAALEVEGYYLPLDEARTEMNRSITWLEEAKETLL